MAGVEASRGRSSWRTSQPSTPGDRYETETSKGADANMAKAWQLVEAGWCQNTMARDREGGRVDPFAVEAVAFCAMGAIERCYFAGAEASEVAMRLARHIGGTPLGNGGGSVSSWNDDPNRTQAEVVAVMKQEDI